MFTLAVSNYIVGGGVVLFLVASVLLILIVLIQRPQGGGLSGAFGAGGGAGSGQTAFGAKTGDALTLGTVGMFVIYLALAITMVFLTKPSGPPERADEAITAPVGAGGEAPAEGAAPAEGGEDSGPREIIPTPIDPPVAPGGEPLPGTPEAALDEAQENRNRASEPGAPAETPPESPADTPADDPDGGGIR